jgi:hypothetical protein
MVSSLHHLISLRDKRYVIPPSGKEQFDAYVRKRFSNLFQEKPDLLHQITLMVSPLELLENGVSSLPAAS